MKTIFYSFIIGLIAGGSGTVVLYLFLNKPVPVQAAMKVTASHPQAKINNESLTVETKQTLVKATASFQTDREGVYTNTITINRRDLQFKHSITAETGYFINTQLPFFSLSYSYNWFLVSGKIGYSFKLNTADYGMGIGINYKF